MYFLYLSPHPGFRIPADGRQRGRKVQKQVVPVLLWIFTAMKRAVTPPKYRLYRPKNLAVVRLDGRDFYFGLPRAPLPRCRLGNHLPLSTSFELLGLCAVTSAEYRRYGNRVDDQQLVNACRKFAEGYYVRDGKPTKELEDMRYAARPLRKLYGTTPVRDFGPLALKAVRQHMITVEDLSHSGSSTTSGSIASSDSSNGESLKNSYLRRSSRGCGPSTACASAAAKPARPNRSNRSPGSSSSRSSRPCHRRSPR